MNEIHEKSPCCRGQIYLFGARRRQCSLCKKTWRVWKKKRGRRKNRYSFKTLFQYFEGKLIRSKLEHRTLSARLRNILKKFNDRTPWPMIPEGPLIVIADGLIEFIEKKIHCVYFVLVRSIFSSQAIILPPYIQSEKETCAGWQKTFASIPNNVLNRIQFLLCDGHGGLTSLAKTYGWELQRCQFHLLASIAHSASCGPLGKNRKIALKIKKLVEIILYQRNTIFLSAIEKLKIFQRKIKTPNLKTVISGFLKHYEDYRTYLRFPNCHLPTTSNSAEFLIGEIRRLQYRARGFRTPKALFSWIVGFCKYRKSVTCRGKIQPN